jgi:adenosylmethionine-8-amino-7-oxononanoate aminotransferase
MTNLLLHFAKSEIDELLVLERGEGPYVFDTHGRRYIDALSSLFCAQIGYSYGDEMAGAATRQLTTLPFNTNWGTAHPTALELAERLAAEAARRPGPRVLHQRRFGVGRGGLEAVPRVSPGQRPAAAHQAIARDVAYHGVTMGALPFTGVERFKSPFGRPAIDVTHASNTNAFRAPDGDDPDEFCCRLLDEVEAAILAAGPDEVALIIAEPVQNSGGCLVPPPG